MMGRHSRQQKRGQRESVRQRSYCVYLCGKQMLSHFLLDAGDMKMNCSTPKINLNSIKQCKIHAIVLINYHLRRMEISQYVKCFYRTSVCVYMYTNSTVSFIASSRFICISPTYHRRSFATIEVGVIFLVRCWCSAEWKSCVNTV